MSRPAPFSLRLTEDERQRLRPVSEVQDDLRNRLKDQMRAHAKTPLERMDLGLLFFSSTADEQGTRELQKLKEKIKHQDS